MQQWVGIWFQWVHDWGYPGIIILMAMESSIVPIPSEIVIPPAAYWAAQGRYSFWGVVLAGLLVGVVRGITVYFYPPAAEASMYLLMVLVLLFRPRGLMGEKFEKFE